MNNQNNQPTAVEEVENQSPEENEKEEIKKTRLQKIIVKLKKVTGDEKKAKLIVGLFIFSFVIIILVIIASLFIRPRQLPPPIVKITPTPEEATPTPVINVTKDRIDILLEDIDAFNVEQKDLKSPAVDLEISL